MLSRHPINEVEIEAPKNVDTNYKYKL